MNPIQMLLFAILQGISELFPISSLGHGVLVPALLGWDLNRQNPDFLPFLVLLHLGTAGALFIYFWRDWKELLSAGLFPKKEQSSQSNFRLFWLLVVATLPAGVIGLLFEKKLRLLFGGFSLIVLFLMINGIILILGDRLKHQKASHRLESLSWQKAISIGLAQAVALIPGISRSGITLIAGLRSGLDYAEAAHFSFLLATPIIGAAGLLEVPKLFAESARLDLLMVLISGVVAGLFAYLSVWFLMRYFKTHEIKALRPFGFYCISFGLVALVWHYLFF
ncbi:MAG: undecaprenyl-diphosphate phosphatase [Nitrospirae bacterium]|nr:undecaprenyl-diphosphate phosphatase [Nitrospirota bacterium]MBI3595146.1 undecaprenyl-diphosphate phosphatase [Nitrospirota bacterium]